MDVWKAESNPVKQSALSAVCLTAGLALMFGFRSFHNYGGNEFAGFSLGVLLSILGVWNLVTSGKQSITVDPNTRQIIVEDSFVITVRRCVILFSNVVGVSIGYFGKPSNAVTWYYLVLKLSNGKELSLFSPGRFYEGGSDRLTVESWQKRLEQYLGHNHASQEI